MKTILIFLATAATCGYVVLMNNATPVSLENSAQKKTEFKNLVSWQDLDMVTYKDVYIESIDAWVWQPEFHECLHDLADDTIHVIGFLQNMSTPEAPLYVCCQQKHMHMGCCGITGPEDIIDLGKEFDPKAYETGDSLVFTGTFQLNSTDFYSLNYKLLSAEVVE